MDETLRIALFLHDLSGGGSQRRTLTLADGMVARGQRVDLVVLRGEGPLLNQVPRGVRLVELEPIRVAQRWISLGRRQQLMLGVPALAGFLRREKPDLMLAAASIVALPALCAHRLVRSSSLLVLRVSNHYSGSLKGPLSVRTYLKSRMTRFLYPHADAIVTVSESVAEDLAMVTGLPRDRMTTIYNPLYTKELLVKAEEPLAHPWFAEGAPPVVLGVGRVSAQKDFATLLRAFAMLRAGRRVRLLIVGRSRRPERREALLRLAAELGVSDDIDLPGFVDNPLPYMARASVFALSSAWEGLPGALLEAMACGCPVVSTDCPGGSREILDHGRCGPLVPTGNPAALAGAIEGLLDNPPPRERLRTRAAEFDEDRAVDRYLDLFQRVVFERSLRTARP